MKSLWHHRHPCPITWRETQPWVLHRPRVCVVPLGKNRHPARFRETSGVCATSTEQQNHASSYWAFLRASCSFSLKSFSGPSQEQSPRAGWWAAPGRPWDPLVGDVSLPGWPLRQGRERGVTLPIKWLSVTQAGAAKAAAHHAPRRAGQRGGRPVSSARELSVRLILGCWRLCFQLEQLETHVGLSTHVFPYWRK